jgi:hypothetical protein
MLRSKEEESFGSSNPVSFLRKSFEKPIEPYMVLAVKAIEKIGMTSEYRHHY